MAKKRERNKNATYSDEFKLKVLEFFDETGEDIIKTLDRFSISRSSFYAWKHRHWDTYLEIKEKNLKKVVTNAETKIKSTPLIQIVRQERSDGLHRKASHATDKIIELAIKKVERELKFMEDNPDKKGNMSVNELAKLLDVVGSYVIPKATNKTAEADGSSMTDKYSRITNFIQNNFNLKDNADSDSKNGGDGLIKVLS